MTLIDTSAWIEQLRRGGDPQVRRQVETLLGAGDVAACARHHEVPLLHHDAHFDLLVT